MSVLSRVAVSIPVAAALGLAACTADESSSADRPPASAASAVPSPTVSDTPRTLSSSPSPTSTAPGPGKRLKVERQFVIAAVGAEHRPLLTAAPTTSATGKVRLETKYSDRALWAPTPVRVGGDTYLVKTGKLVFGGEAYCLAIAGQRLTIDACDAGDPDQLFQFPAAPRGDGVLVRAGDRYLQWASGTTDVTVRKGEGTTFTLVDRGKAGVPRLGD